MERGIGMEPAHVTRAEEHPSDRSIGYCTVCGTQLQAGRCSRGHSAMPARRSRRAPLVWIAVSLLLLLALLSVQTWALVSSISDVRATVEELRGEVRSQQEAAANRNETERLAERVEGLEAEADAALTPAQITARTRSSVFTVESGTFGNEWVGSAFVLRSESGSSILITNYHIVRDAWSQGITQVDIKHADRTYVGTVEAVSPEEDLAAIRVDLRLDPIPSTLDRPKVGDSIVVIGSPFGLGRTVATGVVSAFRQGYLQLSAPVSPGASGAPVLNDRGEVVGVIVAKIAGGGAEGLSFAIPIRTVCRVLVGC